MHEAARAMQVVERGEEGTGPRCATKSLPGTATIQVCDVRYLRRYGPRPARYSPSPFVNHNDTQRFTVLVKLVSYLLEIQRADFARRRAKKSR